MTQPLISPKQVQLQSQLCDALNDWLDAPSREQPVRDALAMGARLDLSARPGSVSSLIESCASVVFSPSGWRFLTQLAEASKMNPDVANADGTTPLHASALCGNAQAIKALVELGANPALLDRDGLAPIHRACAPTEREESSDFEESLSSLIKAAPVLVNAKAPDGTPLHYACRRAFHTAMPILARAGADFEARDPSTGLRPIDLALKGSNESCAAAVAEHAPSVDIDPTLPEAVAPLARALRKGWSKAAIGILSRGANLDGACQNSKPERSLWSLRDELAAKGSRAETFWTAYAGMIESEKKAKPIAPERLSRAMSRAFRL